MTPLPGFRSANRTCYWRKPAFCLTLEPSTHRLGPGAIGRRKLGWRVQWMRFRKPQVCLREGCWVPPLKWVCGSFPGLTGLKGPGQFPAQLSFPTKGIT